MLYQIEIRFGGKWCPVGEPYPSEEEARWAVTDWLGAVGSRCNPCRVVGVPARPRIKRRRKVA